MLRWMNRVMDRFEETVFLYQDYFYDSERFLDRMAGYLENEAVDGL